MFADSWVKVPPSIEGSSRSQTVGYDGGCVDVMPGSTRPLTGNLEATNVDQIELDAYQLGW